MMVNIYDVIVTSSICLFRQFGVIKNYEFCVIRGGGGPMAKNGEKWRKIAMANSAFSFVKFAIFRQFLILEFYI